MAPSAETTYWHPNSLSGHRVIVTGAARGVGRGGITAALLERGASVLLVDRDPPGVIGVAGSLADDHHAVPLVADLCDHSSYQHIIDVAVERLGGIDALINNAIATDEPKPFTDITMADYDLVFDIGPPGPPSSSCRPPTRCSRPAAAGRS